jgi:two-component system phosphate regulon sensor histidine kinase PhoR
MPRNRLDWHLFGGWCVAIVCLALALQWLASGEIAALTERHGNALLTSTARTLAGVFPVEGDDPAAFIAVARETGAARGLSVDLLDPEGQPMTTPWSDGIGAPGAGRGGPVAAGLDPAALASIREGRAGTATRYDADRGQRVVSVSVPVVREGRTTAIVRVSGAAAGADLAGPQRRLLAGAAATTLAMLAAGWIIARRAARPVAEVAAAASRLASGDLDTPLPSSDVGELATLADSLGRLRRQLVERGLTIGRQDTQQEAVLGSMIEGVLAVDASRRVVSLNRAAGEVLGVDPAGALGRPVQEVVRNADLRRFALEALQRGGPVEDDIVLRAARDRVLRVRGMPLRDPSGAGGAVVVVEDITDIRRLENVRRDFVANVSHELKTPVASIKGFVETLLDGRAEDPADRERFLAIVARQADRLGAIIDDLLALSRIEQAEEAGNLPTAPVRVADLLGTVMLECRPRAEGRSIVLEAECPSDLRAQVNAPLLEQALINLVDNAIKYSDPGRPVRISGGARDGGLELAVRDEGAGIEPEHLPRLFERFYRVDKGRSRKLGGTGLGLAIVKHIAQAHGGSVTVESMPGQGSTFRILLPAPRS